MEDRREGRCFCGSTLKCLEESKGQEWVICVGVGCNRKWRAKRKTDGSLPKFKEMREEFNG